MALINPLRSHSLLAPLALLLPACSDSDSAHTGAEPGMPSPVAAQGVAACLLDAAEQPCELLTEAQLRELTGPDAALEIQTQRLGGMRCRVTWSTGRTMLIGKLEVPTEDSLEWGPIVELDRDPQRAAQRFAAATREQSDAERQAVAEQAAQRVSESKDISSADQALAQDMARSMISSLKYDSVAGLGDAAAWGGIGRFKQLLVRSGHVQITLQADVASDETMNREQAIRLAQAVLTQADLANCR